MWMQREVPRRPAADMQVGSRVRPEVEAVTQTRQVGRELHMSYTIIAEIRAVGPLDKIGGEIDRHALRDHAIGRYLFSDHGEMAMLAASCVTSL